MLITAYAGAPMVVRNQIAQDTTNQDLLLHIANTEENATVLGTLATNPALTAQAQQALANNEEAGAPLDRAAILDTAHARLLAHPKIDLRAARLLLDTQTPDIVAAVERNIAMPIVRQAAALTPVRVHRALLTR